MIVLAEIVITLIIVFMAIIIHEISHGWVACKLGDPTAKMAGRLSLNPLKHVDPVGTLLLPGILLALRFLGQNVFLFGWAKPVPVNFTRLRNPRRDMMLVGAAGPVVNLLIAAVLGWILRLPLPLFLSDVLTLGVFFNILLAVFNAIPIPPLDGSRIVTGFLPVKAAIAYNRVERYGILIVLGLLYFGLFDNVIYPLIILVADLLGVPLQ